MRDITIPDQGLDVEDVTISYWRVKPGEFVQAGTELVEVLTEITTFTICAPCSGVLAEVTVFEGDLIGVGEVVARIHEEE
ncbi:MAG: hypothetical protein NC924_08255 [Candidatus Omnitrophica bacterium]|nr:hypothetical protein [Candidatus Omnitrophota bacterium]